MAPRRPMHEFFDHTGDIGVRITASSLEGLFAEAGLALTHAVISAADITPRDYEDVELESADVELLLVDWLSELLYRFDARGFLTAHADVTIDRADNWRLAGRIAGETFDPHRHRVNVLVKAVTYHGLHVRREGQVWAAQMIFDV
jgi:protein archease